MSDAHRDDIAKLEGLYAENPEGRIFTHLAEAYRKAGELDRAHRVLEEGIQLHPDYSSAHVVLGRVLRDEGRGHEAETEFRRVLELDPHNLVAIRSLGDLARERGDRAEALEHYQRLLEHDPDDEVRDRVEELTSEGGTPVEDDTEPPTEEHAPADDDVLTEGYPPVETSDPEEPAYEQPLYGETARADAAREEPVHDEPGHDEPVVGEEPLDEEPSFGGPDQDEAEAREEPTYGEGPVGEASFAEESLAEESLAEESPADDSFVAEPFSGESLPEEPAGEAGWSDASEGWSDASDTREEAAAESGGWVGGDPNVEGGIGRRYGDEDAGSASGGSSGDREVRTETIAQIYARQGLYDRAAEVYRELVRSRPEDEDLRERLAEMEELATAQASDADEVAAVSDFDAGDAETLPDIERDEPGAVGAEAEDLSVEGFQATELDTSDAEVEALEGLEVEESDPESGLRSETMPFESEADAELASELEPTTVPEPPEEATWEDSTEAEDDSPPIRSYFGDLLEWSVGDQSAARQTEPDAPDSDTPDSDTPDSDTPDSDTPDSDALAADSGETAGSPAVDTASDDDDDDLEMFRSWLESLKQ